ncbi:MAG TPA: hypothetical protein VN426_18135 [Syntrophomonadaceae bacterium]|nr:hypothetical protein [Syntrophomonadaceae bacterium]
MNEDKMISMLSNLDDDLIEKEIDNLMGEVECDMESINRKARQKLEKHNKKAKLRKRLPYAAAICLCFIGMNVVYADDISQAVKSFFNKTPVYSTMVDGRAYYLSSRLVLDDNLAIDSFMVSEGRLDMECTSKLGADVLTGMKIVPKDVPDVQYVMGGYSEDGNNKYFFSFMNSKEKNYAIKPFKVFDLLVGSKTFSITLDEAKSLDSTQKLIASEATGNKIDLVTVGANSIEKNGKQAVQLIASFKDKDMQLTAFGQPVATTVKTTFENLGKNGQVSSGTASRTEDIYATDQSGTKHKLIVPADANARPITTFETDALKDSQLTINLPALLAIYEKSVDSFTINIPKDGEKAFNHEVDLVAQKAVAKSIKRLSPTSAELTFQLNTGADKYVSINSFEMFSKDIKKYSAEFSGDKAIVTLEFAKDIDAFDLDISWPRFVLNGNWTINMK